MLELPRTAMAAWLWNLGSGVEERGKLFAMKGMNFGMVIALV
jgi:hypothetical protein